MKSIGTATSPVTDEDGGEMQSMRDELWKIAGWTREPNRQRSCVTFRKLRPSRRISVSPATGPLTGLDDRTLTGACGAKLSTFVYCCAFSEILTSTTTVPMPTRGVSNV